LTSVHARVAIGRSTSNPDARKLNFVRNPPLRTIDPHATADFPVPAQGHEGSFPMNNQQTGP
jgi:hypothetical protein